MYERELTIDDGKILDSLTKKAEELKALHSYYEEEIGVDRHKLTALLVLEQQIREAENLYEAILASVGTLKVFFPDRFLDFCLYDDEGKLVSYYREQDEEVYNDIFESNIEDLKRCLSLGASYHINLSPDDKVVYVPLIGLEGIKKRIDFPDNDNVVIGALGLKIPLDPKYDKGFDQLLTYFEKQVGTTIGKGLHYGFLFRNIDEINEYILYLSDMIVHDAKNKVIGMSRLPANIIKSCNRRTEEINNIIDDETLSPEEKLQKIRELNTAYSDDMARKESLFRKYIFHLEKLLNIWREENPRRLRKVKLKYEEINLQDVFEEVLDFLSMEVENKGKKLNIDRSLNDIVIYGDRVWLTALYRNLLGNAIIHSSAKEDGDNIDVSAVLDEGRAKICVTSYGKGIPEEKQKQLLKPDLFTKGDARLSRSKGWGYGLKIAKRVVDMHSGELSIDSDGETYTTICTEFDVCG